MPWHQPSPGATNIKTPFKAYSHACTTAELRREPLMTPHNALSSHRGSRSIWVRNPGAVRRRSRHGVGQGRGFKGRFAALLPFAALAAVGRLKDLAERAHLVLVRHRHLVVVRARVRKQLPPAPRLQTKKTTTNMLPIDAAVHDQRCWNSLDLVAARPAAVLSDVLGPAV